MSTRWLVVLFKCLTQNLVDILKIKNTTNSNNNLKCENVTTEIIYLPYNKYLHLINNIKLCTYINHFLALFYNDVICRYSFKCIYGFVIIICVTIIKIFDKLFS